MSEEIINSVFIAIITPKNVGKLKDLHHKAFASQMAGVPLYLMVNEDCSSTSYNAIVRQIPFRKTYFFSGEKEFKRKILEVARDAELFYGSGGC